MSITDIAASVRREEYTGENRCLPCTVLNVLVAAALVGGVAAAGYPAVAALAGVGCLATIYLRGYLVPGTPTITRRYFPASALRLFGKEPMAGRPESEGAEPGDGADPLFAAGILDGDGDSVGLSSAFLDAWRAEIRSVRESGVETAVVRSMFDADECTAQSDLSYVVDGEKLVRWESEAALVADAAAEAELQTRLAAWSRLDRSDRLDVLTGLRLFLDQCPGCDGPLSRTERTVDSCCQRPYAVVRSTCTECGETVAEASVSDPEADTPVRLQFLGV